MALASGAHVKIGTYEYMVDESTDQPYLHEFNFPSPPEVEIQGDPGKKTIREKRLFWSQTDWVSGEGARYFDPDDNASYSYSSVCNTRIPGQFTGRPKREATTVSGSTDDADQRPYLAVGGGSLWLIGGEKVMKLDAPDGTWTAQGSNGINSGDKVTAATGDHSSVYYATTDASNHEILRYRDDGSAATQVIDRASGSRYVGLAVMNGRLYSWTGRKLHEYDIATAGALTSDDTYRKVYDTGADLDDSDYGGSGHGHWWGELKAGQNSIFAMIGSEGRTSVYEYKRGRGYPLWELPIGFTGKSMTVQNGYLYVSGSFTGDSSTNGDGGLYALKLSNREEIFVGYFRKHVDNANRQMQEMHNGFGYQVYACAAVRGEIWVYDAKYDAISILDSYAVDDPGAAWDSNSKIGDISVYGNFIFVAVYQPNTAGADDYTVYKYQNDEPANRQATGTLSSDLYSSQHDFGYPMDSKNLIGFEVTWEVEDATTTSGLIANQVIEVWYRLDKGTWTQAGADITSATTPSDLKGRKSLIVAAPAADAKFFNMEYKIIIQSTGGVKQPIVTGLVTIAELLPRNETWNLALRVKNEPNTNARPRNRNYRGSQIRDYLEDLVQNRAVVTYLDGYRYEGVKQYTTHQVTVESWRDAITKKGEGTLFLTLRSVDNS